MTTVYSRPTAPTTTTPLRRDALRAARRSLDDAITAPAADCEAWASNLLAELRKMARVFEKHVRESEGDDGSLPEVLALKPHLQSRVGMMMNDHMLLQRHIEEVIGLTDQQLGSRAVWVESLRLNAGALVDEVRSHQAKGIDLVYEAFNRVDGFG
jgi:hypothetical protein